MEIMLVSNIFKNTTNDLISSKIHLMFKQDNIHENNFRYRLYDGRICLPRRCFRGLFFVRKVLGGTTEKVRTCADWVRMLTYITALLLEWII